MTAKIGFFNLYFQTSAKCTHVSQSNPYIAKHIFAPFRHVCRFSLLSTSAVRKRENSPHQLAQHDSNGRIGDNNKNRECRTFTGRRAASGRFHSTSRCEAAEYRAFSAPRPHCRAQSARRHRVPLCFLFPEHIADPCPSFCLQEALYKGSHRDRLGGAHQLRPCGI